MAGVAYIGQAGTGKTTRVIGKLDESIDFESWPASAAILAITFMHGSRRRLEDKLKPIQSRGIQVSCKTIDSFCLSILQRYRSYLGISSSIIVSERPDEFQENKEKLFIGRNRIRQMANKLLEINILKEILHFSYPIVIVDEFQDCEGVLLEIVKNLNDCCQLIVAADDFQNLNNTGDCPATNWLAEALELHTLEHIWRTNEGRVLNSSHALRRNEPTNRGVKVEFVPSKDVAAFVILSNMQWYDKMGSSGRSVAIVSPVGSAGDAFVRQTLERIRLPMERKGTKPYWLGAKPFFLEGRERITAQNILSSFEEWKSIEVVTLEHLEYWTFDNHLGFNHAIKRAKRMMKLRNAKHISIEEFTGLVSSGIHFVNTYLSQTGRSRIFLTVHGAKNREFDDVFILWPRYTLPEGDLYLRKLMYNAITRAKRKVVVIVQGPKTRRTECPLSLLIQ